MARQFDAASIGNAIATRAIMEDLRAGMDGIGGGTTPVQQGGQVAVPASAGPGAGGDGVRQKAEGGEKGFSTIGNVIS